MVYFANFQHIYFLSELTFCTTILVHHVFLYVWYHRKVLCGMDGTYSHGHPRRVCVSSRFAIHGGSAWKSCEGWMGPISKGTHHRVCVSPRFAIRGRSAFCICEARIRFIPKGACPRLNAVHAVA
jgi:hypothetical protein